MTIEELKAWYPTASNEDINALVATEVMGWSLYVGLFDDKFWAIDENVVEIPEAWNPATDLNDASRVEQSAIQRCTEDSFHSLSSAEYRLCELLSEVAECESTFRASARDRCYASLLLVLEAGK